MKQKLSILIPCYNAERYIELCLQRILSLELQQEEYEVICYNDCSSDNTLQILHMYSNNFTNVKVINGIQNIGPGGGRNVILQQARGKYVWFVDADDLIIANNVLSVLNLAIKENVDVMAFNYEQLNENQEIISHPQVFDDTIPMSGIDFVSNIFYKDLVYHMGYPWRFLVRKDYLCENNLFFPENIHYGEDTIWMPKVMLWAKRIMGASAFCYQYWQHESSTCGQLNKNYPGRLIYERCITTSEIVLDFVEEISHKGINEKWRHFAAMINDAAKTKYINQLPICIGRSSVKERTIFYNYLNKSKYSTIVFENANQLTKYLLSSKFKRIVAEIVAIIYKISHIKSNRTWV